MDEKLLLKELSDLRQCIFEFNSENVYALNKQSLYSHLKNIKTKEKTAKNILDDIYGSIPLLLSDNAVECLENTLISFDHEKFEEISKADFFLFAKNHLYDWQYVVSLCLGINKYLE